MSEPRFLVTDSKVPDDGQSFVCCLRGRLGSENLFSGAKKWRKNLNGLFEALAAQSEECPTLFVPVSFFAGRGPHPIPGELKWPIDFSILPVEEFWRAYLYFHHRASLNCLIGPGVLLRKDMQARAVRITLSKTAYRHEKQIRGAPKQKVGQVEDIVLSRASVEGAIRRYVLEHSCSYPEARRAARSRFREMAASHRGSVIEFFSRLLRPIVEAVFSQVQVVGDEQVKQAVAKSPVVLLPSHRSHFDYILISYVLFLRDLPLPFVAAGINLNFWPFGPLARAAGGFFIRRSIGADFLYRAVLDSYLRYLSKRGHLLEFYIEGGRSRSGGMRLPRIGLLKYLLDGWKAGEREDILLVPVGVTYEKIVEEKALQRERTGEKKRSESLFDLLRLWNIKRKRFGTVVVQFHQPISLQEYFKPTEITIDESKSDGAWQNCHPRAKNTEDLAFEVARQIEESTALTNTALAASVAQVIGSGAFEPANAEDALVGLLRCVDLSRLTKSDLPSPFDIGKWTQANGLYASSGLVKAFDVATLEQAVLGLFRHLEMAELCKVIEPSMQSGKSHFTMFITPQQQESLSYYKNNLQHLFVPAAMLSIAGGIARDYREVVLYRLQQMCKSGYLLPLWSVWRCELERLVCLSMARGWIESRDFVTRNEGTHSEILLSREGRKLFGLARKLLEPNIQGVLSLLRVLDEEGQFALDKSDLRCAYLEKCENQDLQMEVSTSPIFDFAHSYAIREGFLSLEPEGLNVSHIHSMSKERIEEEILFFESCIDGSDG